jgi:hypothetical protein
MAARFLSFPAWAKPKANDVRCGHAIHPAQKLPFQTLTLTRSNNALALRNHGRSRRR